MHSTLPERASAIARSGCMLLNSGVISSFLFSTETSSSTEYTERIDSTPGGEAGVRSEPKEIVISSVRLGWAIHRQCASFVFDGWTYESGIVTTDEVLHQTVNMKDSWSMIIRSYSL